MKNKRDLGICAALFLLLLSANAIVISADASETASYNFDRFARDPSWSTAGNLGLDVGFAVLPIVPNVKRIKEGVKALDKAKDVGKAVPNPYGKLGGPDHRAQVERIAEEIKARGLNPEKEFLVKCTLEKQRRFVDVAALEKGTDIPREFYQVGDLRKSGLPVKREIGALRDIHRVHPNVQKHFVSKPQSIKPRPKPRPRPR